MSYLALARKWRPKHFKDIVGQEHVVQALSNALNSKKMHHAYLFSGTRGIGKTTIARILAKAFNCQISILTLFAAYLYQKSSIESIDESKNIINDLMKVPNYINEILKLNKNIYVIVNQTVINCLSNLKIISILTFLIKN